MTIAAVLQPKAARSRRSPPTHRLIDAVARLGEKRIGALPVVEDGRIVGIMSERDVIYCLRDHGADVLDWPVERVMSSPAITVDPHDAMCCPRCADDPAANPPFAGRRRRRDSRDRVDRRPCEVPDGADRGRGRRDARPISRAPDSSVEIQRLAP